MIQAAIITRTNDVSAERKPKVDSGWTCCFRVVLAFALVLAVLLHEDPETGFLGHFVELAPHGERVFTS